jgi:hypothetical protein
MLKAIVGTTSSVNPPTSSTFTKLVLPDDCRPTTETSSDFVQNNDVTHVHQDENQDAIRNKRYWGEGGQVVVKLSKHGFAPATFLAAKMTARMAESFCLRGARALPSMRIQFRCYTSASVAKRAKKLDKMALANREEAKTTASRILEKLKEHEAGLAKSKPPHLKEERLWSRLDKVVSGWGKDGGWCIERVRRMSHKFSFGTQRGSSSKRSQYRCKVQWPSVCAYPLSSPSSRRASSSSAPSG